MGTVEFEVIQHLDSPQNIMTLLNTYLIHRNMLLSRKIEVLFNF